MKLRQVMNTMASLRNNASSGTSQEVGSNTSVTIIHTPSLLNLRGSEFWVIDVSRLLQAESFDVKVVDFNFARQYPRIPDEIKNRLGVLNDAFSGGIPLVRLSALSLRLPFSRLWRGTSIEALVDRRLHFLPLSWRFLKLLHQTDIIYFVVSQGNPSYLLVVLGMSLLAGRRVVIAGVHVSPRVKASEKSLMKLFAKAGVLRAIHVVDKSHLSEFRGIGCRVEYIPNGVFYERFYSDVDKKTQRNRFVVLFVGAMNEAKGADLIPSIYANLKSRNMKFTLQIFTSGGQLAEQIRDWSKDKPDVQFEGFVGREVLSRSYASASVAIFPSKKEAFPLACLEAQASGTPVVVSNVPGLTQAVTDGVNGVIVPKRDPESFGEALSKIHSLWEFHPADYLCMCRNAQLNVESNFQWQRIAKDLARFIRSTFFRETNPSSPLKVP